MAVQISADGVPAWTAGAAQRVAALAFGAGGHRGGTGARLGPAGPPRFGYAPHRTLAAAADLAGAVEHGRAGPAADMATRDRRQRAGTASQYHRRAGR